jgi:hypothetical protein
MGTSTFLAEFLRNNMSDEEIDRIFAQCSNDRLEAEAVELDFLLENSAAQPVKESGLASADVA